ncbi:MAG: hypothetical protein A2945_00030 [Candidatus Liptonbacteria bacterium RIFCSPLOWO2_01_FULL_52_25]|uniref:Type II secretion system protein GspF domain-containing protein n=1 Tax=Candidatus Liptonbacteria bacterium RIFCSPLOWO2_01_FULL_52_25 TaxID=1798650 RepID=A0A1G2CFT0_9BACT|nr:MAG: hypothetical protein A2945_00030 [Candidatus Liptonbacteria bacterium RIFCSPLOWO2_01_FULL_52_25]
MLYRYIASDKSGKIVESDFEGDNLNQVLQFLSGKELRPISVKLVKAKTSSIISFDRITLTDKVFITKYLALMLRVGTDLMSAINILIVDFDKPAVKNFLLEVRENLSRGKPFHQAFEAHKDVFSPTFVSLVRAAEKSGNLQKTFEELSESLVKEADLKNKIRAALIYPVVLLVAATIIVTFLVTFALPRVAAVFADGGIEPPLFSKVVFTMGLFMGANIIAIFGIVCAAIAGLLYAYHKTQTGRRLFDKALSNMPLIKGIYVQLAIQRLASTMSSLMRAGLPIIESINVAADAVGLTEFRYSLQRIANEGLAKGLTIGEAFKREPVFPSVVTNLIAISEKAGHLDEVLSTLAEFYAANIDSSIKSIVSLLEPLLLLGLGLLVGTIALSIILPIYQLTSSIGG